MEIDGIPIFVFVVLGIGSIAAMLMIRKLTALSKELGVQGASDQAGQDRLTQALYGGETRLHDLGVHRTVWTIRILFFVTTLSVLGVAYLIYSSGIA